ncbi:hypothetical protein LCGC14_2109080, partial [marine sediment metagenome]
MAIEGGPLDPSAILGSPGLKESGGFIHEEFLPRLQGRKGVRLYEEMLNNNSIIGAVMFIVKNLIRQVHWRIEAADESNAAKIEAEFIESAMEDMSITFEDVVSEVLSMLGFGWSNFELIYKLRKGQTEDPTTRSDHNDGRFGWRKIEIRSQDTLDRWRFDEDRGVNGMVQTDFHSPRGPVFIPIEKS